MASSYKTVHYIILPLACIVAVALNLERLYDNMIRLLTYYNKH